MLTPHRSPNVDRFETAAPGLGDVVAAGTKAVGIKPCAPCKRRQAALNAATPGWMAAGLAALVAAARRVARLASRRSA